MSISGLVSGQELRIVTLSDTVLATFYTLSDEQIYLDLSKASTTIVIPVHGAPYLKFNNPLGAKYTTGNVGLEGVQAAFDVLDNLVTVANMKKVQLKILNEVLLTCVVTGVSVTKNIIKGTGHVIGQVSFIKV